MGHEGHRLLAIFAHPDDEAFSTGGTIAKLTKEGGTAYLICATRGEEGQNLKPELATRETLPRVREEELREAARILGVEEVFFLGYRDGTLADVDETEIVGRLVRAIRLLRPHVVVTFGPEGVYGHPDHMAISRYTTRAFEAGTDGRWFPRQVFGERFQAGRLWYVALPREQSLPMFRRMAEGSEDMRRWMEGVGWENLGTPMEEIEAEIDIRDVADVKLRALMAHRTQVGDDPLGGFPPERRERMLSVEHFRLARGKPVEGRVNDLFAGLTDADIGATTGGLRPPKGGDGPGLSPPDPPRSPSPRR